MSRIIFIIVVISVLLSTFIIGCGGVKEKTEKIKLGAIVSVTGDFESYGKPAKEGIELAVDEINNSGGVNGKQIELTLLDDKSKTSDAVECYNKLKEKNIDFLIGSITTGNSVIVAKEAIKDGIPMIAPVSTGDAVTKTGDNVFRVNFTDEVQTKTMVKYISDNQKFKNVAIIFDKGQKYTVGIADGFKNEFEKNGKIVLLEGYASGTQDFKSNLLNLKNAKPDAIYLASYIKEINMILNQAREMNLNIPFLGANGMEGILEKNNQLDNIYFTIPFSAKDQLPEAQSFVQKYKTKYNAEPGSFQALAYDSVYVAMEAIKIAGSLDKKQIIDALYKVNLKTTTGNFKYDTNRNPIKDINIMKIENNQYKFQTKISP